MPLSNPTARTPLHRRSIELLGFEREDGLYDIEARLTDTKTYAFDNRDRGRIEPGVPLHGMLARMTVDAEMVIQVFEADTEFAPYLICPLAAPNFARLAGLRVGPGFLRAANAVIGGVRGCTHLRELLGQMGTVAFQTVKATRAMQKQPPLPPTPGKPAIIGTCLAYAPDSPVVKRNWPEYAVDGLLEAEPSKRS